MAFPLTKKATSRRVLHHQEPELDHRLIRSEPVEWDFEASLDLTRMQLTGYRGSANEASFDVTQPLLPDEKDARGRCNEKGT
jgi:hypothetical protein